MTGRRLPRSARGRALPRAGADTVTWPPALLGRSPLLCLALFGWLGGGLLATAVALVTESPNDLLHGLTNVAAACTGLLLLAVLGLRDAWRRRSTSQPLGRAAARRSGAGAGAGGPRPRRPPRARAALTRPTTLQELVRSGARTVEVDLSRVRSMDAAVARLLLRTSWRLGDPERALVLLQPRSQVRRVLRFVGAGRLVVR